MTEPRAPLGDKRIADTQVGPNGEIPVDLRTAGEAMTFQDCDEMLICIAAILDERLLNGVTHCHMMRWKFRTLRAEAKAREQALKQAADFEQEEALKYHAMFEHAEQQLTKAQVEIARVKQENELRKRIIDRFPFCPDCRDKTSDRHCYRCDLQATERARAEAQARITALEQALAFRDGEIRALVETARAYADSPDGSRE